ncbi:AlkA N-terminal domain-containing protein [Streptomyces afghaniensis]|uniref:AlkA N-terminal domain-containing protein n=1 Tax=Streptomyces afghaniensis TaxID=66865 RepID=UPI0031450127
MVLHGRPDDRHLLPSQLSGRAAQAGEHGLPPECGGLPAGRVPGLQALSARHQPRLPGVEPARRPRGPRHAADRRRRRGPRGRAGPRSPPRLQHPAGRAPAARRTGRGSARARPRPARPDGPAAHRDDGPADGPDRLRRRFRLDPHLQRHRPRGLRPRPERAARPRPEAAGREHPRGAVPAAAVPDPAQPRQPLRPPRRHGRTRRGGMARRLLPAHPAAAVRPRHRGPHSTPDHIACRLTLSDLRDLTVAISRCRRLLDLDADPVAIDEQLRADPVLAPLVDKAPGRRVPRTVDEAEFAVRAVLGQQVSTAAARTHAARLVTAHGDPVDDPEGGLTHLFPAPEALAALDPETLAMPRTRRTTFTTLVRRLADGDLHLGVESDWPQARAQLLALPGFGPWTADVIAMRALGDPDAFLPTDLGIRRAAQELGLPSTPAKLTARAAAWRPWRAYAVQYLWATDSHPINFLPV